MGRDDGSLITFSALLLNEESAHDRLGINTRRDLLLDHRLEQLV